MDKVTILFIRTTLQETVTYLPNNPSIVIDSAAVTKFPKINSLIQTIEQNINTISNIEAEWVLKRRKMSTVLKATKQIITKQNEGPVTYFLHESSTAEQNRNFKYTEACLC